MADDYMSDSFLEQICDVRPGLVRGVGKRKLESHKRHEASKRVGTSASYFPFTYYSFHLRFAPEILIYSIILVGTYENVIQLFIFYSFECNL